MKIKIAKGLLAMGAVLAVACLAYAGFERAVDAVSGKAMWVKDSNELVIYDDSGEGDLAKAIYYEMKTPDVESNQWPDGSGDLVSLGVRSDDGMTNSASRSSPPVTCYRKTDATFGHPFKRAKYACVISSISRLWSHKSSATAAH